MKTYFNHSKMALYSLILILLTSCGKFTDIKAPIIFLDKADVFENDATAKAAINHLYFIAYENSFANGDINSVTRIAGIYADEFTSYSNALDIIELEHCNMTPNNPYGGALWNSKYSLIYKGNAIIESLENSTQISEPIKNRLIGESLFIRAFCHFYLTCVFGDVAYITGTDYRENTLAERVSSVNVLEAIKDDLVEATKLLPDTYLADANERIRPNKWAATALLARIYLYLEDWSAAEREASLLINQASMFQLSSINDVFLKNSKEAIWQLKPTRSNFNTNEGAQFILTGKPSSLSLDEEFVNAFEAEDARRKRWIGHVTVGGSTWFFPHKYKIRMGGSPLDEYSVVLRLAEQYLIRAEARTKLNKLTDAAADIDALRSRAELPLLNDFQRSSESNLLKEIIQERRAEFFTEWGHRWFDLKRTGQLDAVMSLKKPNWKPRSAIFPIPQSEINVNPKIKQNEGYSN